MERGNNKLINFIFIVKNMENEKKDIVAEKTVPAETVKETPKKSVHHEKNLKMFLIGFGGLLALALIIVIGLGALRTYKQAKRDNFTVTVARVLRLAAAKIDGQVVLYSDYADDMKAISKMRDYDIQAGGASANMTEQDMSDQVLWRLANNILLKNLASQYGVKVESADVDAIKSQILQQFADTAEADKELQDRYGWNLEVYTKKVIEPYVLHDKLNQKISTDMQAVEEVRARAQSVLDQIKGGADFAELAGQYGEDGTAANGGDLGWFAKGDMVQEFEDAVFALKKGELGPNLVQTEYGFHIIKLIDTKTEKQTDAEGKTADVEMAMASHILFRTPSADKYLDENAKKAVIHLYIPVHNPFTEIQNQAAQQ